MTRIMAFDIASRTGIAFGRAGGTPRAVTVHLGEGSEDRRLARMLEATEKFLGRHKPDMVVFEAPIGGPRTSHFLVGLAGCFRAQASRMGYVPIAVNIASARRHFLGKHLTDRHFPGLSKPKAKAEIKKTVVSRCLSLGWEPADADQADAMAIFDFASATYARAQSVPAGGLFKEIGR